MEQYYGVELIFIRQKIMKDIHNSFKTKLIKYTQNCELLINSIQIYTLNTNNSNSTIEL